MLRVGEVVRFGDFLRALPKSEEVDDEDFDEDYDANVDPKQPIV